MPTQKPNKNHRRLAPLGLILFFLIPACAGDSGAPRATARPRPDAARAQPGAMADAGWSIVLAAFSGPDAQRQAAAAADSIRARVDLPNIRPQPRGRGAAVVAGAYRAPSDPAAQRDLARAREVTLDGRTPFATAFLAPPAGNPDPGAIPQYHLSRARIEFGAQS